MHGDFRLLARGHLRGGHHRRRLGDDRHAAGAAREGFVELWTRDNGGRRGADNGDSSASWSARVQVHFCLAAPWRRPDRGHRSQTHRAGTVKTLSSCLRYLQAFSTVTHILCCLLIIILGHPFFFTHIQYPNIVQLLISNSNINQYSR